LAPESWVQQHTGIVARRPLTSGSDHQCRPALAALSDFGTELAIALLSRRSLASLTEVAAEGQNVFQRIANVSLNRDVAGFFGFPTVLTFATKSPDESDLSGFLPGAVRQHRTSSSPRQGSALSSSYERG
jgi:hypothetical protein